jgi:pimeloyl-ACP methyl ester carboxylesterase
VILHRLESAATAGGRAPVLLLHGLLGQARNLGVVARALEAEGFHTIALDLRNHGASPHAPGMRYATMAADVVETLGTLGPCAVIGHSMGGKVAMRLALDYPDLVERLLVADIAPRANPGHFDAYIAAMQAIRLQPGLTRAAAEAALREAVPEAAVRGFLLRNLILTPAPAWRCGLAEIAAGMPDILGWEDSGATYGGKVLFARGALSDYVPDSSRPAIRALFPHAHVVTIKAAGHWLHADNPNGFIATVSGFLRA